MSRVESVTTVQTSDETYGPAQARIGYDSRNSTQVRAAEVADRLGDILTFDEITHADFTSQMRLAVVGLDKDHCAYILAARDWLEHRRQ